MNKTFPNILNKTQLFFFYLCLIVFLVGAAVKFPFNTSNINIYLIDIVIGLNGIAWIINWRTLVATIKNDRLGYYYYLFLFIIVGFISLMWSPIPLSFSEKIISSLYLLRFAVYFSVYLTTVFCLKNKLVSFKNLILYLGFIGLVLSVIGWLQYFLYPDLRNLYYLGWDPHYKRIFATFFDPNYLGLILTLAMIVFFTIPSNLWVWIARVIVFITLVFTYSRSSFLSLAVVVFYYSMIKKRYLIFLITIVLFILTIFLLPRPGGVGVRLERTFSIVQRLTTWRQGIALFLKHPALGVGFNSIRYAKKHYNLSQQIQEDHAGAGFDNGFINIAVTTGIIGFTIYILLLITVFRQSNLLAKTSLIAIITHSFFLNSLLFPWVMWWFWVIIGATKYDDRRLLRRQKNQA